MTRFRAELRALHSPDCQDLVAFIPEDPKSFGLLLQAIIGMEGEVGEESFDIIVCTADWLGRKAELQGIFDCRNHLVVREFDFERLFDFISKYAANCDGGNWTEVAQKLSRLGRWEFEDYRPAESSSRSSDQSKRKNVGRD